MRAVLLARFITALAFGVAFLSAEDLVQQEKRDIVFTPSLKKVERVYFNGNWDGIMLCRGKVCIKFEEAFK